MAAMIVEVHLVLANLHEKILHVIIKRIIALTLGVSHHIIEDTPVRRKPGLCSTCAGYNE